MVDTPTVSRRTALKGIGGLAVLGAGGYALTGGVGASSGASITAQNVTVSNDQGNLHEIAILPNLTVGWSGFDESVMRVRTLIEARPSSPTQAMLDASYYGDGYWPVYRETPYLDNQDYYPERENSPGTSGQFDGYVFSRTSELPNGQNDFTSASLAVPGDLPRIILFDDAHGRPDYQTAVGSLAGATLDTLLTGTSIAGGGNFLNGSYGAAGGTGAFDNGADGSTKSGGVDLRFTISLHTAEGQSELAMGGSGEDYDVSTFSGVSNPPDALTYEDLRTLATAGHPAVIVTEPSFGVDVENIQATSTPSGTSGTSAN